MIVGLVWDNLCVGEDYPKQPVSGAALPMLPNQYFSERYFYTVSSRIAGIRDTTLLQRIRIRKL